MERPSPCPAGLASPLLKLPRLIPLEKTGGRLEKSCRRRQG
ncbi:hypothetical protein GEOBRER4_n1969 [Citrifermentans bremense]|uniref:Uncharacterized protein n=1 Tax=Citrifermentans bremense TaxID=60035 RepID=A0A7R7FS71_9BACT|nr:hypothetical protein GEOBRER4_n1969 [Citrifermentans bremense]